MADRPKQFGRRNRTDPPAEPVKTPRPPKASAPTAAPPATATGSRTLKRSLAVGVVAAGALAALATHQVERTPAKGDCTPTGSTALPGPTGTPPAATDAAATGGGIGGPEPCPPGTTRQATSTHRSPSIFLVRRSLFSGWNWSSSSASSRRTTDHLFSAFSASKSGPSVAASSIARGGFGSIGSSHSSGGS